MTGTSLSPRPQPLECRILLRSRVRSRPGRSSGGFPRPGKTGGNEGAYPPRLGAAVTISKITVVDYRAAQRHWKYMYLGLEHRTVALECSVASAIDIQLQAWECRNTISG